MPVPQLRNATVTLQQGRCAGLYTIYTGSLTIPGSYGYAAKLDVLSGSGSDAANDDFNSVSLLGANCGDFTYPRDSSCSSDLPSGGSSSSSVASSTSTESSSASLTSSSSVVSSTSSSLGSSTTSTGGVSSTSSTVSSTASSSSSLSSITSHTGSSTTSSASSTSSSAAVASPYHRQVMGGYKLVGCQTEGNGVRALSARSFAYEGMTLESCMGNCTGFNYWGTEYGSECKLPFVPDNSFRVVH